MFVCIMYVCKYVRMYVCIMCVCVYIYVYIYIYIYIYMYLSNHAGPQMELCFVLLNWSDCHDCKCFPFDIFALVCFLIREQFSRLGCVQKAFELSGSISVAPTGSAWR